MNNINQRITELDDSLPVRQFTVESTPNERSSDGRRNNNHHDLIRKNQQERTLSQTRGRNIQSKFGLGLTNTTTPLSREKSVSPHDRQNHLVPFTSEVDANSNYI